MSIFNHFSHLNLSSAQETALTKLESFLESPVPVFMLKGYAGSGKTTILKGLVEFLNAIEKDFLLMAPTGRAAKVIREKTGQEAFTIHKSIYSYEEMLEVEEGDSFFYNYKLRNNTDVSGKIFIIDEASMLSDSKTEGEFFRFGSGHLLSDLITYSRINNENARTKIIFVGDPFQLPPVTDNSSKAFEPLYLKEKFNLSSEETEMKEVKRQGSESGILKAAAKMRKSISAGFFNDFDLRPNGADIVNPSYEAFLDTWQSTANPKIIIASKNKTCLKLNLQIRERRFGNANLPLQKSDIVIMGGNNYRKGIFNGEFAVINEVSNEIETRTIPLKGKPPVTLNWRNVELVFPDSDSNNKIVKGKVLENYLYGDNYLKPEETQALYVDFRLRHENLKPKTEEFKEAIIQDEYFNALLMKFGYAVTCHKAQGGEWANVFTVWDNDNTEGFNCFSDNQRRAGKLNQNFYRWAYTAITRASSTLYALNPPYFNSYSAMAFLDVEVLNALNEVSGFDIQGEELSIDEEMQEQLSQFNLFEQSVQLQDHFVKVRETVRKQYIEIMGWEKKNLEIWYYFKRENQTAAVKTWTNKEGVFNGKYQKLVSNTNSEELYSDIETLLKNLPNISINRKTVETIISKLVFDTEIEEMLPFTKNLFDDLSVVLESKQISIDKIKHLQYKERYTFMRNQEVAVMDYEYNMKGFFGRVVPIQKQSNSPRLISDIQSALQTFKKEDYAS
ncbi:ATP-dependent DNA helicase [Flavobacterium sp. GNP001]